MNLHDAIEESSFDSAVLLHPMELKTFGYRICIIWDEGNYYIEYYCEKFKTRSVKSRKLTYKQMKKEIGGNLYVKTWEPYE